MHTGRIPSEMLSASVIAVPPLARHDDWTVNVDANRAISRYLQDGGIRSLLYGGNAVFYHVRLSEYADLLEMLVDVADADTLVIPSAGPGFGMMMDQAETLRSLDFPTAMVLPTRDMATQAGIATGVRRFAESFGQPVVLYIKFDGYLDVPTVRSLMDDGLINWIKYAIVRPNAADDPYLRQLIDEVGAERIVSGMGEQPAVVHMQDFRLAGFTSGCVCVAPRLSMELLQAIRRADWAYAESLRRIFSPLEHLRNTIHPVRVLHFAVQAAGIAETGPISPLLLPVDGPQSEGIALAARELLSREQADPM